MTSNTFTSTVFKDIKVIFCLNINWISSELYLFFLTMCSKGLRKSFWKRKLASSPFSKNFMESCLSESTAKIATSSLGLQPTCSQRQHGLSATSRTPSSSAYLQEPHSLLWSIIPLLLNETTGPKPYVLSSFYTNFKDLFSTLHWLIFSVEYSQIQVWKTCDETILLAFILS